MTPLAIFENELAALVGRPTHVRPFVCEGSPLDCEAFIVGFNPATTLTSDFWEFWRSGQGFDKAAWFNAYKKDRQDRPLKPGKTRRNAISNSRRVIEWMLEEASPVRCLETNIHAVPTEHAVDLAPEQRITEPFDFLLAKVKPRVIVAHGADAARHLQSKRLAVRIIHVPHFSRGWSQASARELGRRIRRECQAQPVIPMAIPSSGTTDLQLRR